VDQASPESGFTLIELMVVLLVMGILMAIAIPTFLGVTGAANDRSAQSNLTNAMIDAKAIFAKRDAYPSTTKMAAALAGTEPIFHFQSGASTSPTTISVLTAATTTGAVIELAAWMPNTRTCWLAKDDETTSASTVGALYDYNVKVAAATCTAAASGTAQWSARYPTPPPGH
jgi:type IV pilus assembly protein PilA